ncbi:putative dual specificity protein phosphatase DSP8 [Ananas comosus]|uniref:phosphatidylglycerophosphatase n=1 Tax=Ananas comosus TaxID=4615 RepID=A0A6P5GJH9_ANACO|nr:putative dual specificity protein phosphatase DSP8 [Ananas comosus]
MRGMSEFDAGGSDEASSSRGRKVVETKAKRALVGAGGRILFYPTLVYNVIRNKTDAEFRWWDQVDQFLLLGAVPFPSDVPCLQQLGVRGVVTLNEPFETLVPTSLYEAHDIDHLVIPTRDYLFAPSLDDAQCAVDFIHKNASQGKTTYVHCKAGRGRSTTIVLCYLVEHKHMTPEAALNHVRSRRPRVLLAPAQWQAIQEYSRRKLDSKDSAIGQHAKDTEVLTCAGGLIGVNINDRHFVVDDLAVHSPQRVQSEPSIDDEVLITNEDLKGYDTYRAGSKGIIRPRPIMSMFSGLLGTLSGSNPGRVSDICAC